MWVMSRQEVQTENEYGEQFRRLLTFTTRDRPHTTSMKISIPKL